MTNLPRSLFHPDKQVKARKSKDSEARQHHAEGQRLRHAKRKAIREINYEIGRLHIEPAVGHALVSQYLYQISESKEMMMIDQLKSVAISLLQQSKTRLQNQQTLQQLRPHVLQAPNTQKKGRSRMRQFADDVILDYLDRPDTGKVEETLGALGMLLGGHIGHKYNPSAPVTTDQLKGLASVLATDTKAGVNLATKYNVEMIDTITSLMPKGTNINDIRVSALAAQYALKQKLKGKLKDKNELSATDQTEVEEEGTQAFEEELYKRIPNVGSLDDRRRRDIKSSIGTFIKISTLLDKANRSLGTKQIYERGNVTAAAVGGVAGKNVLRPVGRIADSLVSVLGKKFSAHATAIRGMEKLEEKLERQEEYRNLSTEKKLEILLQRYAVEHKLKEEAQQKLNNMYQAAGV